ncbi:MAG: alpha-1,2-fucosyltransferase [Flavobacteriaceae bacterium]|jgi:hypothetical protein|nr:alpha-1,2-fucosyltransferase [Flavobacteriaceae bacterium]
MVIVKLLGGLGNQMFQYAAGKALACKKNTSFYLNANAFITNYKYRSYDLRHFNIHEKSISLNEARVVHYLSKFNIAIKIYEEKSFTYQEDFFNQKSKNIYFNGFFQSEKYFKNIEPILREDFKLLTPLSSPSEKILAVIKNVNSVSIHIRRGDYVTNTGANQLFGLCDLDYYKKAVRLIESKIEAPHYFIFSDDIEWAKQNIQVGNSKTDFIDFNDSSKNYEDMELMKNCKHNIIANSSFSWWGAWLNDNPNKIVIAPKKWFASQEMDSKDLIPLTWVQL